jgi:hypothetical protein
VRSPAAGGLSASLLARGDGVKPADPSYGIHHADRGGEQVWISDNGSGWSSATLAPGRLYAMRPSGGFILDTSVIETATADGEWHPRIARFSGAPTRPWNGAPSADGRWYAIGDDLGVITVWSLGDLKLQLRIDSVTDGSAALAAGLRKDDLVLGADGMTFSTYAALSAHLDAHERVAFDIQRDGSAMTVAIEKQQGRFGFAWSDAPVEIAPAYFLFLAQQRDDQTQPEWVMWTQQGWFDCSAGGADLISWQLNRGDAQAAELVPMDRLYERFYQPALLRQIVATGSAQDADPGSLQGALRGIPTVNVVGGTATRTVDGAVASATVEFEVGDTGGGVSDVRFSVNGKSIAAGERGLRRVPGAGSSTRYAIEVQLAPGSNRIAALALNRALTASPEAAIIIERSAPTALGDLHLLLIGIDDYVNPRYRLSCSVADASAFGDAIAAARPLFRSIRPHRILNRDAQRPAIEQAFLAIAAEARPADTFILFFSGHGTLTEALKDQPAEYHLVTSDVVQMLGQDETLHRTALPISRVKELCAGIAAQKQLILIDACNAGAATEAFATRGASEERALLQMARATGAAVIAASAGDQTAKEVRSLGHGIFTLALLDGLAGKAAGPDGLVSVRSVDAWLQQQVPLLAERNGLSPQWPMSLCRGMDFPLIPSRQ